MSDAMREKIAEILDRERKWPDAQETAQAIIDAMPGMVQPLVWESNPALGEGGYSATEISGNVYHAMSDGWSLHRKIRWTDANGIEAAKDAAQAHYVAQALLPFGIVMEDWT